MDRVYLSGMAAITPWGFGIEKIPEELRENETVTIPELSAEALGLRGLNRVSKAGRLTCAVIGEALRSAGVHVPLEPASMEAEKTGIILSTNDSNLEAILAMEEEAIKFGPHKVNPGLFPNTVLNVLAGYASIYYHLRGINSTVSDGELSATKALVYAYDLLRSGLVERIVVCEVQLAAPNSPLPYRVASCGFESVSAVVLHKEKPTNPESLRFDVTRKSCLPNGLLPTCPPQNAFLTLQKRVRQAEVHRSSYDTWIVHDRDEDHYVLTLERQREEGFSG